MATIHIDFDTVVEFSNGVRVINATPHPISFLDGDEVKVVPPSGAKVNARAVETEVGTHSAARLVSTRFETSPEGWAELRVINDLLPSVLIVGSMISAQAYGGRVVGMTPAPGFERVPPTEKRMSTSKFTVFQTVDYD